MSFRPASLVIIPVIAIPFITIVFTLVPMRVSGFTPAPPRSGEPQQSEQDKDQQDRDKKDRDKKNEKGETDEKHKTKDDQRWGPIKWGPIDLKLGAAIGRSVPVGDGEGPIVIRPVIQSTFVRNGFGFDVDLPFFSTDLLAPGGDGYPSPGLINVRPIAAGVSWTRVRGPLTFDLGGLGGYSFNGVTTPGRERRHWNRGRAELGAVRDVTNSAAWEARAGVWYEFRPRWSLTTHLTYLRTRPSLLLETGERRRWNADRVSWQIGLARTFRLNVPRPALPIGPQ